MFRRFLIIGSTFIFLFLLWFFVLNVGTATFIAEPPYEVVFEGYRRFNCEKSPCKIRVAAGEYTTYFQKSGYYDIEMPLTVSMFTDIKRNIDFVSIPTVREIEASNFPTAAEVLVVPPQLEPFSPSVAVYDDSRAYYFDDGAVYVWTADRESKKYFEFRSFSDAPKLSISPDDRILAIRDDDSLYVAHLADVRKYRIDFLSSRFLDTLSWSPDSKRLAYVDQMGVLRVYFPQDRVYAEVSLDETPVFFEWMNETQILLVFGTKVGFVDVDDGVFHELISPLSVRIVQANIVLLADKSRLYFESEDGRFFEMNMGQ